MGLSAAKVCIRFENPKSEDNFLPFQSFGERAKVSAERLNGGLSRTFSRVNVGNDGRLRARLLSAHGERCIYTFVLSARLL